MLMAEKNYQISKTISYSDDADKVIQSLLKATQIPQVRLLSRIIEFFATLPADAQRRVLTHELQDRADADIVRIIYERWANRSASPTASSAPPESRQAIAEAIREAADRSMQPQGQPRPNPPHTEDDQKSPPKPHGRKKN
jgi:hypothetical protein